MYWKKRVLIYVVSGREGLLYNYCYSLSQLFHAASYNQEIPVVLFACLSSAGNQIQVLCYTNTPLVPLCVCVRVHVRARSCPCQSVLGPFLYHFPSYFLIVSFTEPGACCFGQLRSTRLCFPIVEWGSGHAILCLASFSVGVGDLKSVFVLVQQALDPLSQLSSII